MSIKQTYFCVLLFRFFFFAGLYSIGNSLPSVENVDKPLDHGSPPSVNSIVEGYILCYVFIS